MSMSVLFKKSGSRSPLKEFRRAIKQVAKSDHLPDYAIEYHDGADQVSFINRHFGKFGVKQKPPVLKTETYEKAKHYVLAGHDVYVWEQDWIGYWKKTGCPHLLDPDKAFISFCKGRHDKAKRGWHQPSLDF